MHSQSNSCLPVTACPRLPACTGITHANNTFSWAEMVRHLHRALQPFHSSACLGALSTSVCSFILSRVIQARVRICQSFFSCVFIWCIYFCTRSVFSTKTSGIIKFSLNFLDIPIIQRTVQISQNCTKTQWGLPSSLLVFSSYTYSVHSQKELLSIYP